MQAQLASGGAAVTPNDGTDLGSVSYGLWIGGAGTLKVDCASGKAGTPGRSTFATTVPVGFFPFKVIRVYATGTTATGITALSE
jgi:hypothetical protein